MVSPFQPVTMNVMLIRTTKYKQTVLHEVRSWVISNSCVVSSVITVLYTTVFFVWAKHLNPPSIKSLM